ncbi:MAG: thiamine-binding protein [Acidimicrobiales bacterium]|nr:thiamine-binding protein [Acidimicrobiales bacterium]
MPQPLGTPNDRYAHVDAAIAVIQAAGLPYEVGALGTTVEGPPDELWPLVRAVHEATLIAGATAEVTVIKVAEAAAGADQPTVAGLTDKFRGGAG